MTISKSLDGCGITWIIDKSKQEMAAFADSIETISVLLKKRKGKRTAATD
jgi:hypothetical protein